MQKIPDMMDHLQRKLFQSVISNNLVYNTCWEDPRLDRRMLDIKPDSRVLMLTSAGDNALDYLLDHPESIECVDINPAQNALLELKKALLKQGSYNLLWNFFGRGSIQNPEFIYHRQLREFLPRESREYWDCNIHYFNPTTDEPSFYFRGTSGKIALMIFKKIKREGLYPQVLKLLKAQTLEEQSYYYEEIEHQLWNSFYNWLVPRQSVMTMLGVPASQLEMIEANYEGGVLQYVRQSLSDIFTGQTLQDNYFWRVYLTGSYSHGCCPNYLRKQNFKFLNQQVERLQTCTSSLLNYLKSCSGTFTHFVLLDHQDWLANSNPQNLAEEWKYILASSVPGSRILFRSVAAEPDFLPDFVSRQVDFQNERTTQIHDQDRVGTYESTHLGIVQ